MLGRAGRIFFETTDGWLIESKKGPKKEIWQDRPDDGLTRVIKEDITFCDSTGCMHSFRFMRGMISL